MIFGPFNLVLRIISAVVSAVLLYFFITFLQVWLTGQNHATQSAQAILVFGTTEDNGTPSPELQARLNQALLLYQEHRAPWVVVTGGNKPGDVYTEAGVSAAYLEQHGVPKGAILRGAGSDTWQNVASVIGQMKSHHLTSVLCVTDPFHEDRAMAIASGQGLTTYPSPVPNSPTVKVGLWKYYLKETLEVGVGRIIGFHLLSEWTTVSSTVSSSIG